MRIFPLIEKAADNVWRDNFHDRPVMKVKLETIAACAHHNVDLLVILREGKFS